MDSKGTSLSRLVALKN